jgi:hypothetical protein
VGGRRGGPVNGTQLGAAGDRDFAQVRDIELLDLDMGERGPSMLTPIARPYTPRASRGGGLVRGVTGDPAPHAAAREVIAGNP